MIASKIALPQIVTNNEQLRRLNVLRRVQSHHILD